MVSNTRVKTLPLSNAGFFSKSSSETMPQKRLGAGGRHEGMRHEASPNGVSEIDGGGASCARGREGSPRRVRSGQNICVLGILANLILLNYASFYLLQNLKVFSHPLAKRLS